MDIVGERDTEGERETRVVVEEEGVAMVGVGVPVPPSTLEGEAVTVMEGQWEEEGLGERD